MGPDSGSSRKASNNRSNHRHSLNISESHIVTLSAQRSWVQHQISESDLQTRKLQNGSAEWYKRTKLPHQVIYIIQAPKEKVNIKDAYNTKAATALGVIHIICGFISLGSDIAGMVDDYMSLATGIWTSVFFFISGGLAIGGARSGNKCLVVATMVMAITSAISAGILLIISAIYLNFFGYGSYYRSYGVSPVSYGLLIAMGATMLIVAIASASLTCYPLCCRSNKQGAVHYQPNQVPANVLVNADQIATLNLPAVQDLQAPPPTSAKLISESAEPPAYQDVAGVGGKYQKF